MSRRPMRFSVHRIVRGVFQIMTVAGVHIKRLQRGELRQVTRAGGIHLGAQPRRTVGHHRQSPRAGERFKVRPDQHGLRPEVLEGLEKIPSTAIVGEHAIHRAAAAFFRAPTLRRTHDYSTPPSSSSPHHTPSSLTSKPPSHDANEKLFEFLKPLRRELLGFVSNQVVCNV